MEIHRQEANLKNRAPALIVLSVLLLAALFTGWNLKQALDVEHELREQMGALSIATTSDPSAPAGAVSLGESSLNRELAEVRATAHHDELYLALEGVGLLLGFVLLRRRTAAL